MTIRTAIVGVTGYTGRELLRWLLDHPHFVPVELISHAHTGKVSQLIPELASLSRKRNFPSVRIVTPEELISEVDLVFLALPHGEAYRWVPPFLSASLPVIDLSADFRIHDLNLYTQAYGAHPAPTLLPRSVYGLSEWYRQELREAQLIANPGCYPTAFLLAVLPFVSYLETVPLVVDTLSGVTGAGRTAKTELLFGELSENAYPYGIPHHRHEFEMMEKLTTFTGREIPLIFTPHLIPMKRGIVTTIHIHLPLSPSEARGILKERYKDEPFVHLLPEGVIPQSAWVRGTNHVLLNIFPRQGGWYTLVSVLDNLGKGAASQAIQNANIRFGLAEEVGLEKPPWFP